MERVAGEGVLRELIRILKPLRIVAVGNDAFGVAARLAGGIPVQKVRHPSYGGQTEFLTQVRSLYGLGSSQYALFNCDAARIA